jgi:hypothetical protein
MKGQRAGRYGVEIFLRQDDVVVLGRAGGAVWTTPAFEREERWSPRPPIGINIRATLSFV